VRPVFFAVLAVLLAPAPASAQRRPLAFVSNEASRDVSVIDLGTHRVVATIPVGVRPRGIQASPDGRRVYVALSDDHPNATRAATPSP
jgi:YVTN family beta-propeller protein